MSRTTDDDAPLDAATFRALQRAGDLVPTTEAEVRRAEAALPDDLELPASLESYRSRVTEESSNPRLLERKRRGLLTHSLAVAAGALAAAAAITLVKPVPPAPPVTSAGGELVPRSASATPTRVPLAFHGRCQRDCCAGADCKAAAEGLRACPSGVRCAGCAPDNVNGGPYRLRVGSVILTEAGRARAASEGPFDVCLGAAASQALCLPAVVEPGGENWRLLKAVSPLQDLLSGLSVELRRRGDAVALAGWRRAVSPTADVMCKGLAVQLGDEKETWGRLSVFVEPAHFVELSRAAEVPNLLAGLSRFDVTGIEPRIFESSRSGADRFALVLGPLEKADAEALRWQLLDHRVETRISHGLDFVGNARPAR